MIPSCVDLATQHALMLRGTSRTGSENPDLLEKKGEKQFEEAPMLGIIWPAEVHVV